MMESLPTVLFNVLVVCNGDALFPIPIVETRERVGVGRIRTETRGAGVCV